MVFVYHKPLTPEQAAAASKAWAAFGKVFGPGVAYTGSVLAGVSVGGCAGIIGEGVAQLIEYDDLDHNKPTHPLRFAAANVVRAGAGAGGVLAAHAGIVGAAAATTLGGVCLGVFAATGGIVLVIAMAGGIAYSCYRMSCRSGEKKAIEALVDAIIPPSKGSPGWVELKTLPSADEHAKMVKSVLDNLEWIKRKDAFDIMRARCVNQTKSYQEYRKAWEHFGEEWYNEQRRTGALCLKR